MSLVVPVLRAVVRDELADVQPLSLGAITSVVSNGDGTGAHNIEVNVRLHGSALELQRVPVLAGRIGLSAAPREGDTAVVAFVGGDLNGPVVLGFLHDDQRHPPKADVDEVVYEVRDDGSSQRRVELVTASGNKVTVVDDRVTIAMGSTKLELTADGTVTIDAPNELKLKAASVTIEATANLELKSGAVASLKADGIVTVEGPLAELKGTATTIGGLTTFSGP